MGMRSKRAAPKGNSAKRSVGATMRRFRMAMENSADMIANLTLYKNKVRQAAITREIIEVVSGAEAL